MELHYTTSIFSVAQSGDGILMITIPKDQKSLYDKIRAYEDDKPKVMTIKHYKEQRSLDSNSGFWVMCDRIGKKLGNNKNNIYVELVKEFGVFDDVILIAEAQETYERRHNKSSSVDFDKDISLCEVVERYKKGQQEWVKLRCYAGTSTYESDEFKPLLDGTIEKAKDMGIPFFSKRELEQMALLWDKRKGVSE